MSFCVMIKYRSFFRKTNKGTRTGVAFVLRWNQSVLRRNNGNTLRKYNKVNWNRNLSSHVWVSLKHLGLTICYTKCSLVYFVGLLWSESRLCDPARQNQSICSFVLTLGGGTLAMCTQFLSRWHDVTFSRPAMVWTMLFYFVCLFLVVWCELRI